MEMAYPQIVSTLKEIITRNSRLTVQAISNDDTLANDLGFDSMSFLATTAELEDCFGFPFPLEKIDELKDLSFGGLVHLVRNELANRPQ